MTTWRPHFKEATRRGWLLGLLCLFLAGGGALAAESAGGAAEYQVKAAFLYNFTKFTEWPADAFADTNAPIVIGVVGADPFGQMLDATVAGEVVRNRPLVVRRFRADEDLGGCHVLFISRSEQEHLPALLNPLKGRPVLTLADASGFAEQGGMVNLLLVQKSVKLEINQAVAETAGLRISAKLLNLARSVKSK